MKQQNDYGKKRLNLPFSCKNCGCSVTPEGAGSEHRNHCPNCLYSLHLDELPGDRASDCGGLMEPITVWVRKNGEWAILHRCRRCGKIVSNRIAADDSPVKLMSIALKPLCEPPFPIERIRALIKTEDIPKTDKITKTEEQPRRTGAEERNKT